MRGKMYKLNLNTMPGIMGKATAGAEIWEARLSTEKDLEKSVLRMNI